MSRPKAYSPEDGYMYQILCKSNSREWEHCDYAHDQEEKEYLLGEYRMAYGRWYEFQIIELPQKYWRESQD